MWLLIGLGNNTDAADHPMGIHLAWGTVLACPFRGPASA